MTDMQTTISPDPERLDLTGRDRMVANVLASWAGYCVFIVAGFILPRLIDAHVGQEALGVWDFGWSLVACFVLVQGGVVSSINRYVAKYRAAGDMEAVNRAVSSVTCVLALMALVILVLAAATAMLLPSLFGERLGPQARDAQWVVLLLGSGLAVQAFFSGFGGVLTGCHRWDLHNAIHAGAHCVTIGGMVVVLVLGGGLPELAAMSLVGDIGGRLIRCAIAYRVYPALRVRLSLARWSEARRMLEFGGKSFIPHLGQLLLNQTTSILVLVYLGPAALAVYARPRALVHHVTMIVSKFSFVLTPTASSLHAIKQKQELRKLLIDAARSAAYITLPMIITLTILGGPLLRLWMGPTYQEKGTMVLVVLALGMTTTIIQTSVRSVLTGMNAHGRPGAATLIASVFAVGLAVLALGPLNAGLVGAALAVAIPLTLANGIYVPIYACRRLGLPLRKYVSATLRGPIQCMIPFTIGLVITSLLFAGRPLASLICGGTVSGTILAVLYWRSVLPPSFKRRVIGMLSSKWSHRVTEPHWDSGQPTNSTSGRVE